MVGKHDPGVDVEGRAGAHPSNRFPQRVDLFNQQIRPAVEQVRREEERPARNPIATIIRHDRSMPNDGERRKALRSSALRMLSKATGLGAIPGGAKFLNVQPVTFVNRPSAPPAAAPGAIHR